MTDLTKPIFHDDDAARAHLHTDESRLYTETGKEYADHRRCATAPRNTTASNWFTLTRISQSSISSRCIPTRSRTCFPSLSAACTASINTAGNSTFTAICPSSSSATIAAPSSAGPMACGRSMRYAVRLANGLPTHLLVRPLTLRQRAKHFLRWRKQHG